MSERLPRARHCAEHLALSYLFIEDRPKKCTIPGLFLVWKTTLLSIEGIIAYSLAVKKQKKQTTKTKLLFAQTFTKSLI